MEVYTCIQDQYIVHCTSSCSNVYDHVYIVTSHVHVLVSVCAVLNVRGVLAAQEPGQALGLDDCQHKMTMPLYLW